MTPTFARWERAERDVGGEQPGARAFMTAVLERYGAHGARDWGVYAARNITGSASLSCHAEGRACDIGLPLVDGRANPVGTTLVETLLEAGPATLGIQAVIWNRTIWSRKSPTGRPYTGARPHYDHVHVELTRQAAASLTVPEVRRALDGEPADDGPLDRLAAALATGTSRLADLVRGLAGDDTAVVQGLAALGVTDRNKLTDVVFYRRHPDRAGARLDATDPTDAPLVQEWLDIRDRIVLPALRGASE